MGRMGENGEKGLDNRGGEVGREMKRVGKGRQGGEKEIERWRD